MNECFADEIAIDFPSVGPVVDRMRHAFLGDAAEADLLAREVSLSSREALDGRVVPVEVPIRGACAACGGRGETWTERCATCCGTGNALFHHLVRVNVPPGVADGACFRFRVSSPHAPAVRVEVRVVVRSSAA
jgi:hypothetical protein